MSNLTNLSLNGTRYGLGYPTDITLTEQGVPADAFATGEIIKSLSDDQSINLMDSRTVAIRKGQESSIAVEVTRTGFRAYTLPEQTVTYGRVLLDAVLKPNTTYTLILRKHKHNGGDSRILVSKKTDGSFPDSGSTVISSVGDEDTDRAGTFVTNESGEIRLRFYVTWDTADTGDVEWSNIMLVEGEYTAETAPPYVRYFYAQDDEARNQAEELSEMMDSTLTARRNLVSGEDLDDLVQPGVYFKGSSINVVHGVIDETGLSDYVNSIAKVIVVGTFPNSNVILAQFWLDTGHNTLWMRTKHLSGSGWNSWVLFPSAQPVELPSNTNMDHLVRPGLYRKMGTKAVINGVTEATGTARILVVSGGSDSMIAQFWFDHNVNAVWMRTQYLSSSGWTQWTRVTDTRDRYIQAPFSTVADAYAALDAIKDASDGRITMETISGILDTENLINAVVAPAQEIALVNGDGPLQNPIDMTDIASGATATVKLSWGANEVNFELQWDDTFAGFVGLSSGYLLRILGAGALLLTEQRSGNPVEDGTVTMSDLIAEKNVNKMRLYKIDTDPRYMLTGGYTVQDGKFYQKPKALVIATQHGDERINPRALEDLFKRFLWDKEFAEVAAGFEWHIVPIVNVWGYNHDESGDTGSRNNQAGININRDYYDYNDTDPTDEGFQTEEARAIRTLYLNNEYSMFLDLHNTGADSYSMTKLGFISIIPSVATMNSLTKEDRSRYLSIWRACQAVNRDMEGWAHSGVKTTDAQFCYLWGTPEDFTANNWPSAAGYIRGNPVFDHDVAQHHPVLCAATVETCRYCGPISASTSKYNRVAMTFGALYVEGMVKALGEAVLRDIAAPTDEHAVMKLRMTNSSFLNSTGLCSTSYSNFQYFASTGTFVDLHGANRIDVEWGKTNSDKQVSALKMWSFDENFALVGALQYLWPDDQTAVGRVVNHVDIPADVRYVKLSVMATDGNLDKDLTITAYGTNLLTMAKEVKAAPNLTSGFRAFGFCVEDGVYTTGRIMLPPNYTPNGSPVPVIIYAHGDTAYMTKDGEMYSSSAGNYSAQWHFLRDCGYAIIDCWPWTSRYDGVSAGDQTVGVNASGAWVMPTSCKAYLRLIETVTQYYNVDAKNIFVLCKSFGGHMAQWLCSTGKVKAGAFLAPGLALLHGGTGSGPYDFGRSACVRTVMSRDLGFEDADGATVAEFIEGLTTDAQKLAFYTKNEKKLCGYWDEFINTVGMTYAEKLDAVLANQRPLNNLTRIGYPPVKLWYAADDTSILRPQVEAMAQQIRNGGGYADTVVIEAGHGGHHAVDTHENAPQETDVTTPLGIHYDSVTKAYYEVFKFFEQHRI